MHIERLRVRSFRNLEAVDLQLDPRVTVFWGDNGQGKTSLLEAVYLLATLKSFRTGRPKDLPTHGVRQALVEGRLVAGGLPRDCSVAVGGEGRVVRLDGKTPRALPEYFEVIKAVAFVPGDLRIIDGGPDLRRAFLDRAAFTQDPAFLELAQAYRGALHQKNALLRQARIDRRIDPLLRSTWNERLVDTGSKLVVARLAFLRAFAPTFRELHERITGAAKGHAELRYRACVPAEAAHDPVAVQAALAARVEAAAAQELERGYATVGPHRDDWDLVVGGEVLRSFGSQGQVRSAALALRVAQMVLARRSHGVCPLFLLDDVSSELDPHRSRQLMELLDELEAQVLVTTTDLSNLKVDVSGYVTRRVVGGAVAEAGGR